MTTTLKDRAAALEITPIMAAEQYVREASSLIHDLLAENELLTRLLKAEQDDCELQRKNKNIQWERAETYRIALEKISHEKGKIKFTEMSTEEFIDFIEVYKANSSERKVLKTDFQIDEVYSFLKTGKKSGKDIGFFDKKALESIFHRYQFMVNFLMECQKRYTE